MPKATLDPLSGRLRPHALVTPTPLVRRGQSAHLCRVSGRRQTRVFFRLLTSDEEFGLQNIQSKSLMVSNAMQTRPFGFLIRCRTTASVTATRTDRDRVAVARGRGGCSRGVQGRG
jgi:hypothetical protein